MDTLLPLPKSMKDKMLKDSSGGNEKNGRRMKVSAAGKEKDTLSAGEASKALGIRKWTLQHYDEIDLFSPTGRLYNLSRYYTQAALTRNLQTVPEVDLQRWREYEFDDPDQMALGAVFETIIQAWEFYYHWKRVIIKADIYREAGLPADAFEARRLGAEWRTLVQPLATSRLGMEEMFARVSQSRSWMQDDLYKDITAYMAAIMVYS